MAHDEAKEIALSLFNNDYEKERQQILENETKEAPLKDDDQWIKDDDQWNYFKNSGLCNIKHKYRTTRECGRYAQCVVQDYHQRFTKNTTLPLFLEMLKAEAADIGMDDDFSFVLDICISGEPSAHERTIPFKNFDGVSPELEALREMLTEAKKTLRVQDLEALAKIKISAQDKDLPDIFITSYGGLDLVDSKYPNFLPLENRKTAEKALPYITNALEKTSIARLGIELSHTQECILNNLNGINASWNYDAFSKTDEQQEKLEAHIRRVQVVKQLIERIIIKKSAEYAKRQSELADFDQVTRRNVMGAAHRGLSTLTQPFPSKHYNQTVYGLSPEKLAEQEELREIRRRILVNGKLSVTHGTKQY